MSTVDLVFVANRLATIHEHSVPEQWHYVPTAINPADDATRSVSPNALQSRWLTDPEYLAKEESNWPQAPANIQLFALDPDIKMLTYSNNEPTKASDISILKYRKTKNEV